MADFDLYTGLRRYLLVDPTTWGSATADMQARRIAGRVALAGLVGASVSTARIYPDALPQTVTYPAVRLTNITARGQGVLRGHQKLRWATIQVDGWSRVTSGLAAQAQAAALGQALHQRLDGYVGLLTDATGSPSLSAQVAITWVTHRGPSYEHDVSGGLYRISADLMVSHDVGAMAGS